VRAPSPSPYLWFFTRILWHRVHVPTISTNRLEGERPRWGRVFIVAGRWKGRLGTYDDDDRGYCVVYPDGVATPVLVRPTSIIEAPEPDDVVH
jgi:hypothetical protein